MGPVGGVFDGLLALVLLVLSIRLLFVSSLFHAVVLFIALGLLMGLTWVRLQAPDVALAEAAIGAALTGVLFIDLLYKLTHRNNIRSSVSERLIYEQTMPRRWLTACLSALVCIALLAPLLMVAAQSPTTGAGLTPAVSAAMAATGVTHEVTAVLLNFRSFDTLLELTVLFVAVLAALTLRVMDTSSLPTAIPKPPDPLMDGLWRLLLPLLVAVSGYLLWLGSFTSGGAFQSGIVMAATIILLSLTGQRTLELLPPLVWRALLVVGLLNFIVVGAAMLMLEGAFLQYPQGWAGGLILLLEVTASLTIATALVTLVLGLSVPAMFKRYPDPR
ncbi:MAG: DUF4040 domain-containing protein [Halomonadaceae bacterium]|nr:MAG: DUF4040 domain-containing protein [Halomonadaceae bacterium]